MSYLKNNNNKVVVDAILTDYGRKKLAGTGKLDIYKFSVCDDEIDYALWNENHPQGSDYYNSAIINLPILQALPGEALTMKYPLFTQDTTKPGYVENMILTYDTSITGSGAWFDRSYAIQPTIVPSIVDITKIYYHAWMTSTVDLQGAVFTVEPIINPVIGITADAQATKDYYASIPSGQNYIVGHGFNFRALIPPRTSAIYVDLHIVAHGVSCRPQTISIKLPNMADAQGYIGGIGIGGGGGIGIGGGGGGMITNQ